VVHAPAYDAVNDRVVFMVNADGTSARYLVAYEVGQGIRWMVPVNSNDALPERARFLYEQIWTYGGQAVTVRSAEDGDVLFRQTGFPHGNSVGRVMYDPDSNVLYVGGGSPSAAWQISPAGARIAPWASIRW